MTLSPAWRQLLGAVGGMAVATLLYLGIQNASFRSASLSAYLVTPGQNIADSAGDVRVNNPTVDTQTLQRLARRAQGVAAALQSSPMTSAAQDLVLTASSRREERLQDQAAASAPTVAVGQPVTVDRYDRVQLRVQRIEALREAQLHGAAPDAAVAPANVPMESADGSSASVGLPIDVTTSVTPAIATPVFPAVDHLSDAGPGPLVLVLVAAVSAVVWRRRSIARSLLAQ